jgi:hypothetical protein
MHRTIALQIILLTTLIKTRNMNPLTHDRLSKPTSLLPQCKTTTHNTHKIKPPMQLLWNLILTLVLRLNLSQLSNKIQGSYNPIILVED